jgi:hypothetical protein
MEECDMRDRPYSWIFAAVLVLVGLSIALTGSVAAQSADLVVATDDSGDHTSIQNAINSASDSDRIEIQSGMYGESINIDKNITIFTSGVVNISNQSDISDSTGISISNDAEPEIIGVNVIGWRYGIKYDFSETDWRVRNVTISDVDRGIQSYGSSGDWRVTNTIIEMNDVGISMNENTGNPTVVNTEIEGLRSDDGTGIIASDTSGDPVIKSVKTTNVGPGVRLYQSTGNWTIESSTFIDLREDSVGIDATESAGSWTIEDTMVENTTGEDGVDADDTEGNWIIENITVKNIGKIGIDAENANAPDGPVIRDVTINETDEEGIDIAGSRSDVLITETKVRNTGKGTYNNGIRIEDAVGDWTIEDTIIKNISGEGIDVYKQPASSQATIRNVTVTDTQNHGVNFYNSSGDWTISNSTISDNGWSGVEASDSSGDWTITNTTIQNAEDSLIGARRASGTWKIQESTLRTSGIAINATGAVEGNASYNYWGATDGPSGEFCGEGGEATGNVTVYPYYTDSSLMTLSSATTGGTVQISSSCLIPEDISASNEQKLVLTLSQISADGKSDEITITMPERVSVENVGDPRALGTSYDVDVTNSGDPIKLEVDPDEPKATVDFVLRVPVELSSSGD